MGNCLSKGQTSDATPNVPREKPLVQEEPDRKVVTPIKASEESTVEGELNEKQAVLGEKEDVASNKSKVEAKEEVVKAEETTETAKPATTSKEPTLHRLDSGKGLSTHQSQRQATPSLDSIATEKEKEKVAEEEATTVQTKDKSSVAPSSTEQPSSILPQSTTESEAKAPEPAPTTTSRVEAQSEASAVAEPTTATGDEKKSTPIVDFDFGIASDWPLKLDGDGKAADPVTADKEETKDTKATPPLTHLITTIPPSTEGEEFKTAVSHPSTASPSVLSPKTTLAEAETQQTSAPSSPLPVESSNTKDTPLSITVPKRAESKFNEASDDAGDSKLEATESAIRPTVSRTSTKDSNSHTPLSAVSDKSKRQSRISRMFSTASKKQSRKISPNPPSKRMTLAAMPERSPVREKIPEVPALTTITTTESGRPLSGTPTSPGATSPGPILEGRKWKEGEDNESLYCL